MYVYVCVTHVCGYPLKPEEGTGFPGAGGPHSCKSPSMDSRKQT